MKCIGYIKQWVIEREDKVRKRNDDDDDDDDGVGGDNLIISVATTIRNHRLSLRHFSV
jgi:hypothetical protein